MQKPRLKFVLLWSVFLKLDIFLLYCNLNSCRRLSRFKIFCTRSTFTSSTSMDCQFLKSDTDFWRWCQLASKQDSSLALSLGCCPCDGYLRHWEAIQNYICVLDSTWSCCGQARASSNKHPLMKGILPKMVVAIFLTRACSAVTGDSDAGAARWIVFAACPAIVAWVRRQEPRLKFVLLWSVFLKLDIFYCIVILIRVVQFQDSRFFVHGVLTFTRSTSVDCQFLKSDTDFWQWRQLALSKIWV